MSVCAIKWCGKNSRTSSHEKDGITFHRFPKCTLKKSKWIDATCRGEGWIPSKSAVICSRHFTEDCFHITKNRRRLMDSALPTLYLPVLAHRLSSSKDDAVQPTTSKTQAESLQTAKIKYEIDPLPDTPSAYDSPTKKRLCRRVIDLQNTVDRKNKIIKKERDSNRRLIRKIKTIEPLLAELEKTAENRDILNSVGAICSEIINRQMLRSKSDKSNELHEGFSCNSCSGNIIGYRYTCVQCANYDLCNSCEARGEHSHHYVLRIPKPAPFAEINAVLSKIRTQLLYGLDNDDVEDQEEAGDPQPCMTEETIKVEIKEELPDPLEHEDAFTTDDNYTETDTTEFSAPKETTTAIVPNVKTSTMTLTESGGNLFIIENPISIPQTVPTISKKHKTTSAATQAIKRVKVEPLESDVTCEFMEVPVNVSAGSSTEGGSGELLRQVLTTRKPDEEASFQVFSHTEKYPVEAKPGPEKSAGKKTAGATTKKKKSDANTLNN